VRISEAGLRDALSLLALHRAVFEEGAFFITRPEEFHVTLEEMSERIRMGRARENSVILCARSPAVVGFVSVQGGALARMMHAAKLEIMVSRAHRGQGVGRALMEAALSWAEANPSVTKIGLSVFADNDAAIGLYRSMGFEEEGRREREYKMEDGSFRSDVLMYRFV